MAKKEDAVKFETVDAPNGGLDWVIFPGTPMRKIGGNRRMKDREITLAEKALYAYVDVAIGKYEHPDTEVELHFYRSFEAGDDVHIECGVVSSLYAGPLRKKMQWPSEKDEASMFPHGWAYLDYEPNPRAADFKLRPCPDGCADKHNAVSTVLLGEGREIRVRPFYKKAESVLENLGLAPEEARKRSYRAVHNKVVRVSVRASANRKTKAQLQNNGGAEPLTFEPLVFPIRGGGDLDLAILEPQRIQLFDKNTEFVRTIAWDGTLWRYNELAVYQRAGWSVALLAAV